MSAYEQDVQIAKDGASCGLGGCQSSVAGLQPSFKPEEVFSTSTFCLPGAQGVSKTDYRGLAAHLQDAPAWCEAIELAAVPHFTTFQKAAQRLLRAQPVSELLDETVSQIMGRLCLSSCAHLILGVTLELERNPPRPPMGRAANLRERFHRRELRRPWPLCLSTSHQNVF